jgi:methionine-rich copper-binding protein CopC
MLEERTKRPRVVEERAKRHRTLRLLLFTLLSVAVASGPAAADTVLVDSRPGDGTTVMVRPDSVRLDFANPIIPPAAVAVVGPDGQRVDSGEPAVLGNRVQQPMRASDNGVYTVVYRVVGDDTHRVQGQLTFTLDAPVAEPRGSWLSRNGGQLIGAGVVLLLIAAVAALRLRPRLHADHPPV